MFALAAIATYTYVKFKNESRYPDIYSENTDGPVFLYDWFHSFLLSICTRPGSFHYDRRIVRFLMF